MQHVLILGAGGHAQVIANILLQAQAAGEPLLPIGYVDDNPNLHGRRLLGLPVLGSMASLRAINHDAVILGIGDNGTRRRLFRRMHQQGEHFAVARHPSAVIAPDVSIAPGTVICAGAIVNPGSTIGANVILNTGCTVDHHNRIAAHVHIAPGAHLGGDVHVGEGTLVGIGATVMPQRQIGDWVVVGAGALVHTSLPNQVVAIGVPAKVQRLSQTHESRSYANPDVLS